MSDEWTSLSTFFDPRNINLFHDYFFRKTPIIYLNTSSINGAETNEYRSV